MVCLAPMKAACLTVAVLALPMAAHASEIDPATIQLWDVVHTTDGSVLKGIIVEEIPGTSVRIVLVGGSSIVVESANVVRFAKELNPGYARQPAAQIGGAVAGEPALTASSGLRIGVMPGLAYHTDGDPGFLLTSRLGWEIGLGSWGLTPGVVIDFTPDVTQYGEPGAGFFGAIRAAYRATKVSPFVGFGLGVDTVDGDGALATFMGAGLDLLLHRRFALSAEVKYHRGFGDTYIQALSFVGIGIGVEVRI